MTDDLQVSGMVKRLELSVGETDAERLGRIRRAMRDADPSAALVVSGSFEGDVTDPKAYGEIINLLLDSPLPLLAAVSGPVGQRGIGLLLAADHAILGPEARAIENWRAAPGVPPLLHHRLGPSQARRMLFGPSVDLLQHLADCGVAARASDPVLAIEELAAGLTERALGSRLKRSLKAASEMPLKEALAFDLWFSRSQEGGPR